MANIDTLRFGSSAGDTAPCINVDAPVGPTKLSRVQNLKGDVMLIQASFFALAKWLNVNRVGLQSMDQVPVPTGLFDAKTEAAIRAYQGKKGWRPLNRDGVIDPASYRNRTVRLGGPLMTITNLHLDLGELALLRGFEMNQYPQMLSLLVPQLGPLPKKRG